MKFTHFICAIIFSVFAINCANARVIFGEDEEKKLEDSPSILPLSLEESQASKIESENSHSASQIDDADILEGLSDEDKDFLKEYGHLLGDETQGRTFQHIHQKLNEIIWKIYSKFFAPIYYDVAGPSPHSHHSQPYYHQRQYPYHQQQQQQQQYYPQQTNYYNQYPYQDQSQNQPQYELVNPVWKSSFKQDDPNAQIAKENSVRRRREAPSSNYYNYDQRIPSQDGRTLQHMQSSFNIFMNSLLGSLRQPVQYQSQSQSQDSIFYDGNTKKQPQIKFTNLMEVLPSMLNRFMYTINNRRDKMNHFLKRVFTPVVHQR